MALPEQRDREEARSALATWLGRRLGDVTDLDLSEISGPPSTGFSNETLIFDATWQQGGRKHREGFVVRVHPTTHTVFPTDLFETQFRVMAALAEHSDVPVPAVRWYEDDPEVLGSPFFVMERVEGEAPSDSPMYTTEGWLHDDPPERQAALWNDGVDVMARIHGVDWRAAGLGDLDPGTQAGSRLAQRLTAWEDYLAWAGDGRSQPVPEAAAAWLRANLPADDGPPALCWGDSRIGNQLFVDHRVVAVLDWEMVHIGDPVQDLAWFVWLDRHHSEGTGETRLPGFPSYAETVERWGATTGRSAGNFAWHQVQAGLGFAAVMVRLASLLSVFDLVPLEADFEHTNTGVTFLRAELERLGVL